METDFRPALYAPRNPVESHGKGPVAMVAQGTSDWRMESGGRIWGNHRTLTCAERALCARWTLPCVRPRVQESSELVKSRAGRLSEPDVEIR